VRVRITFVNDGLCGVGVDKGVFVRDITVAGPRR
jgi:hypothetical protein